MKFASSLRKESKPMIIAENKDDTANGEKNYKIIKEKFKEYLVIPCSLILN
jgi:ribosome-binding ATPase YchF (GTP1/OBG family)